MYPPLAAPDGTRHITYFKRFRMEIDLEIGLPTPVLPFRDWMTTSAGRSRRSS